MLTENLMTYRELKHKAKEQLKTGTNRRDLMLAYLLPSLLQAAASIVAYLAILAVIQSFGVEKTLTDPNGFQAYYMQNGNNTGTLNTIQSLVNTMLVQGIKKIATLGAVSTVISTAAGFLVGTYVPIGALPNAAQVLLKCTPGAYIAALYRETLMGPTLTTTFQHHAAALTRFRTTMGVRIAWSSQLTVGQTYGIVGSVLLIALFFALLPQWRAARQRRALVNA